FQAEDGIRAFHVTGVQTCALPILDATECPRDITFCAHALVQDPPGLMEVPDAREDIRFHDNPAVRDGMRVRFYAGVPLVTPDNHILGTLCVIDQTPRHLTTEQREGLQALARQVSALLELRQARRTLEQRNAQLERLHHENSQLAGMVAHDLRNPLQVIDGYGKLMLNGLICPVTPDQQTALEAVTRNCAFMLSLVNDLLSISCLNAGALELDLAETDAGALVAANVELNRLLSTAKDIRIDLVVEKDLPPLRIDAFKIEQVLNNLISNAIKFSWPHT